MKTATISTFLLDVIETAGEHKIKVILDPNKVTFGDENEVSGLFDSENAELTVNISKPTDEWTAVMVHESCHMDQHIEQCKPWTDLDIKGHDATTLLDMWLEHVVDLNQNQLSDVLNRVIAMELDCEVRSVEKIKKYKLPINISEYIQKANAYMYFYRALGFTRKWTTKSNSNQNSLEYVWKQMPTKLFDSQADYKDSDPLVELIVNNCFKKS
jgi:hypothetical protein